MNHTNHCLGILGGMGPLASAEFVKNIYRYNILDREQDMPRCILISDPTIPDRTAAIEKRQPEIVIACLQTALEQLKQLGVSKIVMTCVTGHYFLPAIAPELREMVISLVDVILDRVISNQSRCLLVCTNGTRSAEVFQRSTRWMDAAPFIALPNSNDQQAIHEILYRVKQGYGETFELESMLEKYQVLGIIAGCTEVHLLVEALEAKGVNPIVDPLTEIARNLALFLKA